MPRRSGSLGGARRDCRDGFDAVSGRCEAVLQVTRVLPRTRKVVPADVTSAVNCKYLRVEHCVRCGKTNASGAFYGGRPNERRNIPAVELASVADARSPASAYG